jgi:hypothetical protein
MTLGLHGHLCDEAEYPGDKCVLFHAFLTDWLIDD